MNTEKMDVEKAGIFASMRADPARFEHFVQTIEAGADVLRHMTFMSKRGWELVTVTVTGPYVPYVLWWKRPIPATAKSKKARK